MPGTLWPAQGFSIIIEETKMQKILLTGLLILLLAVPAPAAEKEVAGVFFPLPEGWSVVEENTSGTTSTLLLRQEGRRTAIAVMVAADAGLAPARIATELASVTGATADPVEREGQYSLPHQERRSGWRLFSGAVQRAIHPGQRAGRAAPGRAPAGRHALPGRSRPCAALIFPCPENGKRPCAATGTFFYGSLPERAVPRPEQMLPSAHGSHGTGIVRLSLFQES